MAPREGDAEHSQVVAIGGLGLGERLDSGVPLLHESAKLVPRDVHAIEVRVAVVALHFLALHAHLSPGLVVSLLVQIAERNLEHATTERVSGNF